MQVSVEKFSKDPVKYLDLAAANDIVIEKNGENVARLTSALSSKKKAWENLLKLEGILSTSKTPEELREERLMEKYGPLE